MKKINNDIFEISIPEKEGVSSKSILDFLSALYKYDINMHSVLIFRNFKLIFDGYYKPFDENTFHRMFSITKSFVSAGIGILAGKGKINPDEPVINYFPEYAAYNISDITKKATVRNLLEMKSPHEKTAFKQINDDDYVKSFFLLKPSKIPGTAFSYDTSASHTLCALVEKISGKSLLDFLRDEFLNELGFSKDAYCLKDPLGISLGGSGIMARPLDIAVFAHVFLNGGKFWGKFGNKQVIPMNYVNEAVSKRSETFVKGVSMEEKQGYGYQFWRISHNGYICYGIAGQLAVILPDFNFVMITTADTLEIPNGVGRIFELFWDTVYKGLSDGYLPENKNAFLKLLEMKNKLAIKPIEAVNFKRTEKNILWNFSVSENDFGIKNLTVNANEDEGNISFLSSKGEFNLKFGFGRQVENVFPFYKYRCIVSGAFFSERCIVIKCHIIDEEIGAVYIQVDFNDKGYGTMLTKKNVGTGFDEFNRCYLIKITTLDFLPHMR